MRWRSAKNTSGFALLMSLMAVVVLTTIVVELSYNSRVAATIAQNHRDGLQALYLAKAGVGISVLRLEIDKTVDSLLGKKDDAGELHWSMPFAYPVGLTMLAGGLGQGVVNAETTEQFVAANDLGGSFQAEIYDESAKININALKITGKQGNLKPNGTFLLLQNLLFLDEFKKIVKDRNMQETLYDIVDWIDADKNARGSSSNLEDYFYQALPTPYHAKNGPFFSVWELRLVREIDYKLVKALLPYITVYPYSTTQFLGVNYGKININAIGEEVFASIFDRQQIIKPVELAKKLVEIRDAAPFSKVEDFYEILEKTLTVSKDMVLKDIQPMLTVRSDIFRVSSTGDVGGSTVNIDAVLDRSGAAPEYFYWKVN